MIKNFDTKKISIDDMEFKCREYNILRRAGCVSLYDILQLKVEYLMNARGVGKNTYKNILNRISEFMDIDINTNLIFQKEPYSRNDPNKNITIGELFRFDMNEGICLSYRDAISILLKIESQYVKDHPSISLNEIAAFRVAFDAIEKIDMENISL